MQTSPDVVIQQFFQTLESMYWIIAVAVPLPLFLYFAKYVYSIFGYSDSSVSGDSRIDNQPDYQRVAQGIRVKDHDGKYVLVSYDEIYGGRFHEYPVDNLESDKYIPNSILTKK